VSSLKRFDGEIMADNRASGLPVPGHGTPFVNLPSLYCFHCGGHVVPKVDRTRSREYCRHCNHYVCDGCWAVAQKPDYKHRTIDDFTEMVTSGRYRIVGGNVCDPILIPTGVTGNV
jgi:hypothetical protein